MADKPTKQTTKQIGVWGENQVVARLEHSLVFVEVKTRRSTTFGRPEEAVTKRKIQHLVESEEHYLQEHPDLNEDLQIDLIAIQHDSKTGRTEITHFENEI